MYVFGRKLVTEMVGGRSNLAMPLSVCQPRFRITSWKMAWHDATVSFTPLRFLITDSPCHECAVSLLLSVKSLRLLFTCAIGWVSIDSLNANIDFINERFFVFRGKLLL